MTELEKLEKAAAATEYDPATGVFTWKRRPALDFRMRAWNTRYGGQPAGREFLGYTLIQMRQRKEGTAFHVFAHRLAWFVTHGAPPEGFIDHIDQDKANNRPGNLRDVSHRENSLNGPKRRDNTSGATGVMWRKHTQKWVTVCHVEGKRRSAGSFDDFDAAVAAVRDLRARHGYTDIHGER